MKRTLLFLAAAIVLTGCKGTNIPEDAEKDRQELESTKVDFIYTTDGRTVSFRNQSDSKVSKITWDFGDGYTAQSDYPKHTYDKDGDYLVTLKGSWAFNGHYLNKTCEKTILVKQTAPEDSKMYISGFKLLATSGIAGSYYYRFECGCNNLWGKVEPNIKTDYSGMKLNSDNIPYTMTLNPEVLIGDTPNPLDYYATFDVRVFFAANIGADGAAILDERIQAADIPNGATEYVITNNSNGAKVAILFSYK